MPNLTFAPLPSFGDICFAVLHKEVSDAKLARCWCKNGDVGFWYSRSAWSLLALTDCYSHFNNGKKPVVWLPDYFCNSSLVPLRVAGVRLVFYPITAELAPDSDWCMKYLFSEKPDIFILVHYFGQPTSADSITELCKAYGTWLVEDATHVLQPIPGIGEYGDFVLYSPHKHLAIPDGALLVVRKDGPNRVGENQLLINSLRTIADELIVRSSISNRAMGRWLLKRILQLIGFRGRIRKRPFWPDSDYSGQYFAYKKMSSLSKRLLLLACRNLDLFAQRRKKNLVIWQDFFYTIDKAHNSIKKVSVEETPYLAPFAVEDYKIIVTKYAKFIEEGFPIMTWPDLPPEVLDNHEEHRTAISLRKTRFYLAVHQTLSLEKFLKTKDF